jgi:hypothetical protein
MQWRTFGCLAGSGGTAGADAGGNATLDAGRDPGADEGVDPGLDPGVDPGSDAGTDPGADTPPLPSATCGNGRLDPHEACDGALFPPSVGTCDENNLGGGQTKCRDDCTLDVSGCDLTDYCEGNGFYGDKDCDACLALGGHADPACATGCGADGHCASWYDPAVGAWSCPAAGFGPDPDCGTCGNGVVEGREFCDLEAFQVYQGVDLGSCKSWGFAGGTIRCREDCRPDFAGCTD